MLNRWMGYALASTALLASAGAHAARDFTPQAGTWIVSSELDGKPGRGLAIDVQGNTFFMQVFGYEKNGDATFYAVTGEMDGNAVSAPLMRYKGGRSFGGGARDAVADTSLGDVTVSFSNGLKGTVQFPGEKAMAIERFLVNDDLPGITNPKLQYGVRELRLLALDSAHRPVQSWSANWSRPDGEMPVIDLMSDGAKQRLACSVDASQWFHCTATSASQSVQSMRLRFVGYDLAGTVQMGGSQPQQLQLMGHNLIAFKQEPDGSMYQQTYSRAIVGGPCTGDCKPFDYSTAMPFNGTWVVEDELTGKPGRGLALDIQGNTAILQVFNYRADGAPTFHMGSASYVSLGGRSYATQAQMVLNRYQGGRYVGGPAQSAQAESSAGTATVVFSALGDAGPAQWTTGTITLPGEAPKRIRLLLAAPATTLADKLMGEWYSKDYKLAFTLDRMLGQTLTNADGSVQCRMASPPFTECSMAGGPWVPISAPYMNRGGDLIQLRDRFGNGVGLGQLD